MCTLVVDYLPGARVPVLLAAVRDEFVDREWVAPGAHWPAYPGLIGGRDLLAGGTWLAVDPAARRAGCVLNGRGAMADADSRRSRGDLPLHAAASQGPLGEAADRGEAAGSAGGLGVGGALSPYDPFHLVRADTGGVELLSWDGHTATRQEIGPGTHVVVNTGLDPNEPRAARFCPRFAGAARPDPGPGDAPEAAWKPWLPLVEGDGLPPDDPAALIVRRAHTTGLLYGSTSITLVALAADGVRYDFCGDPAHPSWTTILPG